MVKVKVSSKFILTPGAEQFVEVPRTPGAERFRTPSPTLYQEQIPSTSDCLNDLVKTCGIAEGSYVELSDIDLCQYPPPTPDRTVGKMPWRVQEGLLCIDDFFPEETSKTPTPPVVGEGLSVVTTTQAGGCTTVESSSTVAPPAHEKAIAASAPSVVMADDDESVPRDSKFPLLRKTLKCGKKAGKSKKRSMQTASKKRKYESESDSDFESYTDAIKLKLKKIAEEIKELEEGSNKTAIANEQRCIADNEKKILELQTENNLKRERTVRLIEEDKLRKVKLKSKQKKYKSMKMSLITIGENDY